MFPEDIEYLFQRVPIGTLVRVINEPVKIGKYQGKWVMQVNPLLNKQKNMRLKSLVQSQLEHFHLLKLSNSKIIENEIAHPTGLIRVLS